MFSTSNVSYIQVGGQYIADYSACSNISDNSDTDSSDTIDPTNSLNQDNTLMAGMDNNPQPSS